MSVSASGPLQGVRVLDLTINVLGPYATQILGDMGADVIKVETPLGDHNRHNGPARSAGMSALFMSNNRNKRSLVLNLKNKTDLATLMDLVETADVFIHSMRSTAANRLGIGYQAVSARNKRIIYGFGCGYRQDGPKANRPAYDDVIQGESGLVGIVRDVTGEARYVPTIVVDKLAGTVLASAVGMALFHRERTGLGQEIHVPMLETTVSFLMSEHLWEGVHERADPKLGYPRLFNSRPLRTSDGHISLCAISDAQWQAVFEALELEALRTDARFVTMAKRSSNFTELYRILGEILASAPTEHWRQVFDAADIPNGPINSLSDVYHDPYLRESGFWVNYDHPSEGACVTPAVVPHFSVSPGNLHQPAPRLGEHSAELIAEIQSRKRVAKRV